MNGSNPDHNQTAVESTVSGPHFHILEQNQRASRAPLGLLLGALLVGATHIRCLGSVFHGSSSSWQNFGLDQLAGELLMVLGAPLTFVAAAPFIYCAPKRSRTAAGLAVLALLALVGRDLGQLSCRAQGFDGIGVLFLLATNLLPFGLCPFLFIAKPLRGVAFWGSLGGAAILGTFLLFSRCR